MREGSVSSPVAASLSEAQPSIELPFKHITTYKTVAELWVFRGEEEADKERRGSKGKLLRRGWLLFISPSQSVNSESKVSNLLRGGECTGSTFCHCFLVHMRRWYILNRSVSRSMWLRWVGHTGPDDGSPVIGERWVTGNSNSNIRPNFAFRRDSIKSTNTYKTEVSFVFLALVVQTEFTKVAAKMPL